MCTLWGEIRLHYPTNLVKWKQPSLQSKLSQRKAAVTQILQHARNSNLHKGLRINQILYILISFSPLLPSALPVQTECMQESGEAFHDQQDGNGQHSKGSEDQKNHYRPDVALPPQGITQQHLPQHQWQLCEHTKGIMVGTNPSCLWITGSIFVSGEEVWLYVSHHVGMRMCETNVSVPNWEPRVGGRKPCWRCSPSSTRWYGWPDAWRPLQHQTPVDSKGILTG